MKTVKPETRSLFNSVSMKESFPDSDVSAQEADTRATAILAVVNKITEFAEPAQFSSGPTWTLTTFWPREGVSHAAEIAGYMVEVADMEPRECHLPKGTQVRLERVVSIYPKGQNPEQAGTVFMYLQPNTAPQPFLMTGPARENGSFNCASFAFKGDQRQLVKEAVEKLVDRLDKEVPSPAWSKNFERNYVVHEGSVYVREVRPSRHTLH